MQFESSLQAAAQELQGVPADEQGAILDSVQPTVVPAAATTVELDQQLALMDENAIRYDTLVGAYERSMSLLRLAILEGKNQNG